MTKIWSHTLVSNEENFIWFSLMSVVDYVDKMLVWDTGSTDKTVEIIKKIQEIKKNKIEFREVGPVDKFKLTRMRQKMLEESVCDWILILDGDEIWWENSIKRVVKKIQKEQNRIDGIVVPMVMPVGDIYHFQEEAAGKYHILGRKGHLNLRAINKHIPGLHVDLPYPLESYLDRDNQPVQKLKRTIFLDVPYFHATHLNRSTSKRKKNKFKYELGDLPPAQFKYPEVLFKHYPDIVSSPWIKISELALIKAKILTPLRKIKRRLQNS